MIDDKKIEEAMKAFVEDKKVFGIQVVEGLRKGFKSGVQWGIEYFFKDLWHDASEEPKAGKYLYIDSFGQIEILYRLDNDCPWEEDVETYDVVKWLQLDDLFPKQKGGGK